VGGAIVRSRRYAVGKKAAVKRARRQARRGGGAVGAPSPGPDGVHPGFKVELLEEFGVDGPVALRAPTPGVRKLSDVLQDFAEPVLDSLSGDPELTTDEAHEVAFRLAVLAWNTVVLGAEGAAFLEQALGRDAPPQVRLAIETLMARKRARYGDDRRFVAKHELRRNEADPRLFDLNVAYSDLAWADEA
jgi:hypothetical protein